LETILAITNSINTKIKLIQCKDSEDAYNKMEMIYNAKCIEGTYDGDNTYIDKDSGYAQIVDGLEQIELRIGLLTTA